MNSVVFILAAIAISLIGLNQGIRNLEKAIRETRRED